MTGMRNTRREIEMNAPQAIGSTDLFVLLERAFRRESRNCGGCTFTLPYELAHDHGDWSVIPGTSCSDECRQLLEDLVSRYRTKYRLAEGDPRRR
jgi:hypothetical protein